MDRRVAYPTFYLVCDLGFGATYYVPGASAPACQDCTHVLERGETDAGARSKEDISAREGFGVEEARCTSSSGTEGVLLLRD